MNVDQVLGFLHAEKEKLDRVIASLEELEAIGSLYSEAGAQIHEPRGAPYRSARMKRFWTKHRKRQ